MTWSLWCGADPGADEFELLEVTLGSNPVMHATDSEKTVEGLARRADIHQLSGAQPQAVAPHIQRARSRHRLRRTRSHRKQFGGGLQRRELRCLMQSRTLLCRRHDGTQWPPKRIDIWHRHRDKDFGSGVKNSRLRVDAMHRVEAQLQSVDVVRLLKVDRERRVRATGVRLGTPIGYRRAGQRSRI